MEIKELRKKAVAVYNELGDVLNEADFFLKQMEKWEQKNKEKQE